MFDRLIESSKQKQGKRARRLFVVTGLIYAAALAAFGVMTIIGFSPALAEGYDVIAKLIPPPPPPGPAAAPQPVKTNPRPEPEQGFVAPDEVIKLPSPDELINLSPRSKHVFVSGAPYRPDLGGGGVVPGGSDSKEALPPPPPPPTPEPKPVAKAPEEQVVRLTSQLTQGQAIRKSQPPYPAIARQARVQGPVQVQISISESGAVTDAFVLSGHSMLRDVSLQAAKQWFFRPTELNGRPVRAIGMITFNFVLN